MNWIFINLISWALLIFGVAGPLYIALVLVGLTGLMEVTKFETTIRSTTELTK